MKTVKIKKNGKIFLEENGEKKPKSKKIESLKQYLACELEIEPGLSFGNFLKIVFRDKDFFDVAFANELGGTKLEDLENKMNEKVKNVDQEFKIEFLEVSKIFEMFAFENGSTIDLFSVFVGMGKTSDDFDVYIPLSIYFANELKDMPLVLNKMVEIYSEVNLDDDELDEDEEDYDDEDDEIEEGAVIRESITRISVYETIQTILYEMTFHKTEEEKVKARENLNNGQMHENKIYILEEQLARYVEEEEYEKAATTKKELDKLKAVQVAKK